MIWNKNKTSNELELLNKAVAEAFDALDAYDPVSPEYAKILEHALKLYAALPEKKKASVSIDGLITAGANLAGILFILHHERLEVVVSKALSFAGKLKN